ncbi:MAG: tetraacyldisaccharide 4'-kinase, partial [Bacteroidia bacterium]|nr:tetraacyldisaccharide 4'-kinase [Bacteroidia bacterium]
LNVPIISIGNITVGGTGKTPMAEFLLKLLQGYGIKTAYLSRGYKRKTTGYLKVNPSIHNALNVGDEALQVASKFPNSPVAVCENRVEGAERLIAEEKPDVIILDDAFQHRAIARDVDIVMIDGTRLPWSDFYLPFGYLRESVKSLKRADLIIISKVDEKKIQNKVRNKLSGYPRCFVQYKTVELVPFTKGAFEIAPDDIATRSCMTFCGIANPASFIQQLNTIGLSVLKNYRFPDHHYFKPADLERMIKRFRRVAKQTIFHKSPIVVTTEKDYYRIQNRLSEFEDLNALPVYYLKIEIELGKGSEIFDQFIQKFLTKLKSGVSS